MPNIRLWLLILPISLIVACGGKSTIQPPVVITQPPKYCPRPVPPQELSPPLSQGVLVANYQAAVKAYRDLLVTVECYEGE